MFGIQHSSFEYKISCIKLNPTFKSYELRISNFKLILNVLHRKHAKLSKIEYQTQSNIQLFSGMINNKYQTQTNFNFFQYLISNIWHIKFEFWIDLDFRYSRLKKKGSLDSDSKVECWIQFELLYSRCKKNNVKLSLMIDIRK